MTPRCLAIGLAGILVLTPACLAQIGKPLEWLQQLIALAAADKPASAQTVESIRNEVEHWIALHPGSHADLSPAPPQPWTAAQIHDQIIALEHAVEALLQTNPDHPFHLGLTVVNVTESAAALSPVFDTMDQAEIRSHDALTASRAIDDLPGVSVDHKSPRNQTGISIGGFDSRQVPLFIDGIPAYVPFDGYVDLNRYLTSDIAEVQVAKEYSSPLLGPNVLGGLINLVTRQPQKRAEADAFLGSGSGAILSAGLHLGSRWRRFFFQAAGDWLQSDFYPISHAFLLNTVQPNRHRVNSSQRDEQVRGRIGWNPKGQDSYVLSYSNQKGNAGIPPYSGAAPACPPGNATVGFPCVTPKYWSWPQWNAASYYFISSTNIGERSSIHFRSFYEEFPNILDMFDDATYTTMAKPSSGILNNLDHSLGAAGEFDTRLVSHNSLGASFFVNGTTHQEQTATFSPAILTPRQTDRDLQSSFGLQDVVAIASSLRATLGFSADHLDGLHAEDLNAAKTAVAPFQVAGVCSAMTLSFTSCTDHLWTYNPIGSISYSPDKSGTLFLTFADKSRFPTLKDRYSYKAGKAVPNPALSPERAASWTAGYSRIFALRTVAQIDFFRSNVRDEIENIFFLSPLCAAGGGKGGAGSCQQAVNVGRETHQGANFTVRTTLVARLTFDANYTYLNRKITGAPGVFPFGTPRHKTSGTATLRLLHGATGLVSARYQSGAVGMSDNSLPLPAAKFATIDVGGSLPVRAGLSIQAGLRNLLDRNYYYWEGFPEEGRNWYFTLRYKF